MHQSVAQMHWGLHVYVCCVAYVFVSFRIFIVNVVPAYACTLTIRTRVYTSTDYTSNKVYCAILLIELIAERAKRMTFAVKRQGVIVTDTTYLPMFMNFQV